jgi:phosphatidylinositol alpha-1,6-mannosyltransferase
VRLLILTNDYPPDAGGIQQYVRSLAERFPGEVLILAPRASRAMHGDEAAGTHVRIVRARHSFLWPTPGVLRWIERNAASFAPEAVLFASPFPLAGLGPRLRARFRVPQGVLTHGAEVMVPAGIPVVRKLVTGPLRRADVVFTNSRFTTGGIERLLRRPAHYLGVGVDAEVFSPGARAARPRPVVGTVSRFVPRKRQADVVDAVAALRARGHDLELLVVGRGRLERSLRRRADARAVPTRFEIDVEWSRLPGLYREMDVFALPCRSRWMGLEAEGLGIVFLEAAASGLPVVAGNSGGAPETVVHGETGFVVRDREELEAALDRLLSDPTEAAATGARGRERMRREFSWDDVVVRLVAGLEEARSRLTDRGRDVRRSTAAPS